MLIVLCHHTTTSGYSKHLTSPTENMDKCGFMQREAIYESERYHTNGHSSFVGKNVWNIQNVKETGLDMLQYF